MEESIQDLIDQLQRSNRLKDSFLGIVAHELRAPLHAVLGYIELLQRGLPEDQQQEALAIMHQRCQDQLNLVDNLLDHAQQEAGQLNVIPRPTVLGEIIEETVRTVRPQTEQKHMRLIVNLPEQLPRVQVDPDRLRQVLLNLLDNALKYTPDEEQVTIGAEILADDLVKVSVSDTGTGIEREYLDLIFQPFARANAAQAKGIRGTGLGLPITKSLVELQGGRIWVESEPGRGNTFHFTLPVASLEP